MWTFFHSKNLTPQMVAISGFNPFLKYVTCKCLNFLGIRLEKHVCQANFQVLSSSFPLIWETVFFFSTDRVSCWVFHCCRSLWELGKLATNVTCTVGWTHLQARNLISFQIWRLPFILKVDDGRSAADLSVSFWHLKLKVVEKIWDYNLFTLVKICICF